MIDFVQQAALVVYAAAAILLAVYALHSVWLLAVFLRHRRAAAATAASEEVSELPAELPRVLVQLPVFNERDVVERLVAAAGRLRWPRERLRIQLLDDSTDDSAEIGAAAIEALRDRGIDATIVRRLDRTGYKAGALAAGLDADADRPDGPAEFVAIFDADFVPPADFVERAIVPLLRDERLALVQGRWDHLNRDANVLTRAQALGIDAHFAIEQGARAWSGLAMNFNGTCGMWRRAAILDAGGWEHDTLTEDMDLSYRVQLAGWRCTYRLGLAVPGEIPATVSAWRAQQFRWAKGSIQTALKLMGRVWRSPWPLRTKAAATLHLTHYLVHPLILASLLAAPIAMPAMHRLPAPALLAGLVLFVIGAGTPIVVYAAAQLVLRGRKAWHRLGDLPILASIGTGVAVSDTVAVWQAVRGKVTPFVRTPKQGDRAAGSYRAPAARGTIELACAAWAAGGIVLGASSARPWIGPLLLLYCSGFAWVGARLLWEGRRAPARAPADQSATPWLIPIGVASLAGYAVLGLQHGSWRDQPVLFAGVGVALGALYLAALAVVRRRPQGGGAVAWIVGAALAMRVLALGMAPSDDVNRYIVEGAQVRAGENPYLVAPEQASVLAEIPDDVRAGVNHADWSAIYPPATLAFEAIVTSVSVRPMAFKIAVLIVEAIGLGAVLLLLARTGLPTVWLLAAAWNPVGPLFGAGEGHQDFVTAALLAVSLVVSLGGRVRMGVIAAALAALTKPFALVTLPTQITRRDRLAWLVPALVALAAYLPFAAAGPALFRSLGRFGGEMHFHGALEPLVRGLVGHVAPESIVRSATVAALAGVWVLASVAIWRHGRERGAAPATLTARLLVALLLCLPTLHPWYMAPLVLLLPFTKSLALSVWTAMAPIYWLHGLAMQQAGGWTEVPWVTHLAHAPAVLLLTWECFGGPMRRRRVEPTLQMSAQTA